MNAKRVLAAILWFYAGWGVAALVAMLCGVSDLVGPLGGVVAAALVVTVGLGLAGTLLALNQKPATVLRNL